jgi:hypothetical protein
MADLIADVMGGRLIVGSSMVSKTVASASPSMHSQTRREKLESQKMKVINSTLLVKSQRRCYAKELGETTGGTSRSSTSEASEV